jgi:hypothetical protein
MIPFIENILLCNYEQRWNLTMMKSELDKLLEPNTEPLKDIADTYKKYHRPNLFKRLLQKVKSP